MTAEFKSHQDEVGVEEGGSYLTLQINRLQNVVSRGFPGGSVIKNLPANAGDTGLSPGPGRSHMPRSS